MSQIAASSFQDVLEQACAQIDMLQSAVEKASDKDKGMATVRKSLEDARKSCESVKEYKATHTELSSFQQKKLLRVLKSLPDLFKTVEAQMRMGSAQVALFWQVMFRLQTCLVDAFERATVTPKRYKVEGVTNERLDR